MMPPVMSPVIPPAMPPTMARARMFVLSLLMLIGSSAGVRAAGEAAGSAAASYLSIGSGASAQAMAGATLASGGDLTSAAWNPASLARLDALQFSLSHSPLPGGATQDWLAGGGRMWGGSTRWGLNALFHNEGGIEGRDALNQPTGTLGVSNLALGANLARPFGSHASAGLGVQWLHESLAGSTGAGLAFDAGVRAEAGALGFAVAARHLGGAMRYDGASYDLPAVVAAGASWTDEVRGLRVNADFESPSHYYRAVRVGGEWAWRGRVALRAGYRQDLGAPALEALSGATFGFGAGAGNAWMDYSFSPEGGEGVGQHRVGLTFRPGLAGQPGHAISDARSQRLVPTLEPAAPKAGIVKPRPAPAPSHEAGVPAARITPPPASQPTPSEAPAPSPAPDKPSPPPARQAAESRSPLVAKPIEAPAPRVTKPAEVPAAPVTKPTAPPAPSHVTKPDAAVASPAAPVAPVARPKWVVVAEGETMAAIARRWGTTVAAIMMTNDLVRDRVVPGQRLRLPAAVKR